MAGVNCQLTIIAKIKRVGPLTDSQTDQDIAVIDRMQLLCDNLSKGMSLSVAAAKAGYKAGINHAILSSPRFQAYAQQYFRERLQADALRAREVLREFLDDEGLSASTRIESGKLLVSWSKEGKGASSNGLEKPLSEMTGDEIRQRIEHLQREVGVRAVGAKTIDAEPHNAPVIEVDDTQDVDILG